jgi:hypothetical protein
MHERLLRHHEIDLAAWDACVASAQEVVPYAHSWWLQATAGRWDAVVEIEEKTGRYIRLWPLPVKRRLWGREVYQPPFTQQLGTLTVARPLRPNLAEVAKRYARFYTQLNEANGQSVQGWLPAPSHTPVVFQTRFTYHLPLEVAYDVLRAGYAADYRRRLRLNESTASPLLVTQTQDMEPLLALFGATKGTAAGLKLRHYRMLGQLAAELQTRQLLELVEVRHPQTKELLAGAMFVKYRTRLIYLFAAASVAGKKAGAPLLLLDHQIRKYSGTPDLILDFEGGMIPSIARFFANFGATPVPYAALSFTSQRPWYLSWMR